MEMVNGYVFLDLTKSNVYAKALKVLGADKPVVIKEGTNAPYFVDSLTLDGTNVVITKGGKTITIANDNTITNTGDIQKQLWYHGISMSTSNLQVVNFTILNNSSTTIDTLPKIIAWMQSLEGQVNIIATGNIVIESKSYCVNSLIKRSDNTIDICYNDDVNNIYGLLTNVTLSNYFNYSKDDVNRIY